MNYEYEEKLVISENGTQEPYICHLNPSRAQVVCTPPHSHEYIEVLYCTGGTFDIWLNGKYFEFTKGDRVAHAKFGEGTVLEAQAVGNDMRLKINFDAHGEKNLMAVYAKLTKLN